MRITDTDARFYRKKEFANVLEQHEKEKKDKYLQNCLEMRKDFMPMVYSVDGIAGCEAWNVEKRLATHLAVKWNREYSQMVGLGWRSQWSVQTASSFVAAMINNDPSALSFPTGLP
jgi:hypothetical protein